MKRLKGGVWEGVVPSLVHGLGACPGAPRKKNQFCAKNYAILSKFWYFFPILQQKVGVILQSWKWGIYPPVPPAPTPMAVICWKYTNKTSRFNTSNHVAWLSKLLERMNEQSSSSHSTHKNHFIENSKNDEQWYYCRSKVTVESAAEAGPLSPFIINTLAAAQCIVIGPVCVWVCGCVCLFLGLLPR